MERGPVRECRTCGSGNPGHARFCNQCGTWLLAVPRTVPAATATATVVLRLAASDSGGLRNHRATVRREIQRLAGRVEQLGDDAVLAAFVAIAEQPSPDDRAVEAGLRIAERVWVAGVRGVITIGSVEPDLGSSTLLDELPKGVLLVGPSVEPSDDRYLLAEPDVGDNSHGWRIVHRIAEDEAEPPAITPPDLVGRKVEMAWLMDAFQESLDAGISKVVCIRGPSGIGKTRLLEELGSVLLQQGTATWHAGAFRPGRQMLHQPLAEIVKSEAGIVDADDRQSAGEKLRATLGGLALDDSEIGWVRAQVSPLATVTQLDPVTLPPDPSSQRAAWRRLLEALAADKPAVVVFEDVDLADPSFLRFVSDLVVHPLHRTALVVCSSTEGIEQIETLELGALDDAESEELLRSALGGSDIPERVASALGRGSWGHPLYLLESLRLLVDDEIIEPGQPARLIDRDADLDLPLTVQAVIGRRIDSLDLAQRWLLQEASVIGGSFWQESLGSVPDAEQIPDLLQSLIAKGFIHPTPESSLSVPEYAFTHELAREAAYRLIPKAAVAYKHADAARWFEAVAGDRVWDFAEIIARHWTTALEAALESVGAEDLRVMREKARWFSRIAGDQAAMLDPEVSIRWYERALELRPERAERVDLLLKLGRAARGVDPPKAVEFLRLTITEAKKNTDDAAAGAAMAELSRLIGETDRVEQLKLLGESMRLLERSDPQPEMMLLHAMYAQERMQSGFFIQAAQWAERALELDPQLRSPGLAVWMRAVKGMSHGSLGDREGLSEISEAIDDAVEQGLILEAVGAFLLLARSTGTLDGPTAEVPHLRSGISLARRAGLDNATPPLIAQLILSLVKSGQWDEAGAAASEALREFSGNEPALDLIRAIGAGISADRGDLPHAAELMSQTRTDVLRGDPSTVCGTLLLACWIQLRQGLVDEASQNLAAFESMTDNRATLRILFARDAIPLLLEIAGGARAFQYLEGLEADAPIGAAASLLEARARVLEFVERYEPATEMFWSAATHWENLGVPSARAHCLLGVARCLKRLGQDEASEVARGQASEILEPMGVDVQGSSDPVSADRSA